MFKKRPNPRILSLFLLIFNFYFSSAQNVWQPQKYSGVAQSYKKALFSEQFNDNSHAWPLQQGNGIVIDINNGFLELNSDNEKVSATTSMGINENENFEIETSLKFVSGNENRAFGLQWGRSNKDDRFFSFVIGAGGQYAISKYSGAYISYKQEKDLKLIKPKDFNKLTIRKVDNMVYFFINEALVHSMEYKLAYGNLIGFQSGGGNNIRVDYLVINKLDYKIINNPPQILIKEPVLDETFVELEDNVKAIEIYGTVKDEEPITTITINGTNYPVQKNGSFSANLDLTKGLSSIKLSVADNQLQIGEEYINIKRIKSNQPDPAPELPKSEVKGDYYALIIAVNDYKNEGFPDLSGPIPDAKKLKSILTSLYTFDNDKVILIENPNREDFIVALDNISATVKEDDNLIIFYAGHGFWDDEKQLGYWVPADASLANKANWFMNSTLKSYIASINTKHILLISDACFAGGIFRSRGLCKNAPADIAEKYSLPSRKAMTSGNLQEVPDKSEFLKYLSLKLSENKDKFVTAASIFNSFEQKVKDLTNNDPQYGTINNSGDQGGEFIFIHK